MNKFKIGLQLYSVRDEMEKDVEGTLKKVADMGYECVEFAGYFGYSAKDLKALCEKYNLEPISVHQGYGDITEKTEETVSYVKELGVKYYAIPWMDIKMFTENFDEVTEKIKAAGKYTKENGIQLMYHNHNFEFENKIGDKSIFDSLFDAVPSDYLTPEMDTCWVHYAGENPMEYVKKYGDVMEVLHLKDFECKNLASGPVYELIGDESTKNAKNEDAGFEFRPIGYGRQDIKAIIEAAESTKVKYLIVEQDGHPQNSSLDDAKISIDYLRSIGY